MKALLIYLLVTSVCTGVFYGCFRLLMWKETCFAFNRATLLLIVILPLTIPFLPSPGGWSWTGATIPETTFATRLNGYSTAPPLPVANSGISRTGVPEDRGAKERPVVRIGETVARRPKLSMSRSFWSLRSGSYSGSTFSGPGCRFSYSLWGCSVCSDGSGKRVPGERTGPR